MIQENNIIFSSSGVTNQISRVPSQISLKNEINFPITSASYLTAPSSHLDQNTIYSQVNRDNYTVSQNTLEETTTTTTTTTTGFERIAPPPIRQQQINYNSNYITDFDNYSQVINEEDTHFHHQHAFNDSNALRHQMNSTIQDINPIMLNTPYSMKTNTQLGSIIATTTASAGSGNAGMYRAVEYTKSPILERVRVTNLQEDMNDFDFENFDHFNSHNYETSRGQSMLTSENCSSMAYRQDMHSMTGVEDNEKTFVVKLFPLDEQENEVQEMTMYVEK